MTSLPALIDEYLAHVRAIRAPATHEQYRSALRGVFLPWADREGLDDLDALTPTVLDRYSLYLRERPVPAHARSDRLTPASIRTYVRSLNVFLGWCAKHAGGEKGLTAVAPSGRPQDIEVLTRDEIDRLEKAAPDPRDQLIIRLLADTGIREGELLGLRPCDVVREDGRCYIRVSGKTGGRTVGIDSKLYRRIHSFAEHRRGTHTDESPLFVGQRLGRDGQGERLGKTGVLLAVRHAGVLAGISKNGRGVYPHLLRHSFATWYLNQGGSPLILRRDLGHSSLAMIDRVYVHLADHDRHDQLMKLLKGGRR